MNVLIAEDEPHYAAQLQDYLQRFASENGMEIKTALFTNGAELTEQYRPQWDLLMLDVNMPGMDGISAAKCIREQDPSVAIMFITNLAQYAIRGYEVQALDYILKPVSYYALSMKLRRVLGQLLRESGRTLLLAQDGNLMRVPLTRLCYVEVYDHSLRFHTTDGVMQTTGSRSLSQVEEELQGEGFVRCHSSYLVNLRYVDGMRDNVLQVAGEAIPVSRNRRKAFLQALMDHMKGGAL